MRGIAAWMVTLACVSSAAAQHRLAWFDVEVTPPIGHPCMGGGIAPVKTVDDPLYARGFVFLGAGEPVVVVAVDWCEIRNDAYERWRSAIAQAAGTTPVRVMVAALHQHDAPIADLEAQRLLDRAKAQGKICDLEFHERTVQRVAAAVEASLAKAQPITHYTIGQAKVERVASNRRYLGPDGKPRHNRMSATRDPKIREAEDGVIDPWLKTIRFQNGDRTLVALHAYATHPMSYYGRGAVTADFVGLARRRRETEEPGVGQLYFSGCSGNVTAGKYNDGAVENRPALAERIRAAMAEAARVAKPRPLANVAFRSEKLRLEPRDGPGFTIADLEAKLADPKQRPFNQCLAALGLSWRQRADAGATIDLPALDFGDAVLLLMPAESYVEYQLMAQSLRPKDFVVTLGYGESAPGYIPHEQAVRENDGNLHDWNWVAPGAEPRIRAALEKLLKMR